jgi:hypothetical protein
MPQFTLIPLPFRVWPTILVILTAMVAVVAI